MASLRFWFILAIGLLTFSLIAEGQQLIDGRIYDDAHNGVPDVAVTDGFSVVKTKQDGSYTLESHPQATFVYFSVPAGYRVPLNEGLAAFYSPIDTSGVEMRYDFRLSKLHATDKQVLVVGADPQVMTAQDALKWTGKVLPDIDSLLRADYTDWEKAILLLGDIVGDNQGLYPTHLAGIKKLGVPFYHLAGNHDVDYFSSGNESSKSTYSSFFGPTYYSFNMGGVHFVVLDNVFFLGAPYRYMCYLPEQQLRWLSQDLAELPPNTTVVVCTHIPLEKDPGLGELQAGYGMVNRRHLYEVLKPYRVHFFAGHTHRNSNFKTEEGIFHEHGAISGQWWTGTNSSDGTPIGYAVYEVLGDQIKWYFKSSQFPKSHQFRVYPPTNNRDTLIVNVWNYDSDWKVEWFSDGKFMGEMERFEGIDESTLQQNDRLPAEWSYVRPSLNAHMFRVKVTGEECEIEIRVTDRFGNIFFEKVNLC